MSIIRLITCHIDKVKSRNEICDGLIEQTAAAQRELEELFEDTYSFIEPTVCKTWFEQHSQLINSIRTDNIGSLKRASHYKALLRGQNELYCVAGTLKQRIREHNAAVAEDKVAETYRLIGDVEGRRLDRQQITCIVKDVHNHIVIAGAGTGKTTTVIGKIKLLLKSGRLNPEDILVLSFTNASASEMSARIAVETGCDNIEVSTFHKLGLNIITRVNGVVPKITQLNLRKFIKENIERNMRSADYLALLNEYLLYNRVVARSEFDFKSEAEYKDYLALNPPVTLNKDAVKSYGEMEIANLLAKNGVKYIYEQPYFKDTRTSEYGQYKPDFYLPEYDIYIEYFGINREGNVPAYFKGKRGMTASQAYQASIKWKGELHEANNTKMLECYAYEHLEGQLTANLEQALKANGVKLCPQAAKALWAQISSDGDNALDGISELFETIINLIKSNNYTIAKVRKLNVKNCNIRGNSIILSLIEPIYKAYCDYLRKNNEIDFNDMINMATEYVNLGKYTNPYKYVIVDEYQDISKARFLLLTALRKSSDYDLFCVGDDWQSIYRFAGSDIGFILSFESYWGYAEESKIETTYRFTKSLIEVSGGFIMQNPLQRKKSISGQGEDVGFALGEINAYTDKYAVKFMADRLNALPQDSSVFLIGRYSFDIKLLNESNDFECRYNNVSGALEVKYSEREDLKISFMTAHRAKGLQADYVFVINNKSGRLGFPSKIQDAAILNLLLEGCDTYPYAEERRLFYVALTRARKKVFLLTVKGQESEFTSELKELYGEQMKREAFACPVCGGRLVKRTGPYGEFYGCSNYSTTGCTYKRKVHRG